MIRTFTFRRKELKYLTLVKMHFNYMQADIPYIICGWWKSCLNKVQIVEFSDVLKKLFFKSVCIDIK